MVEKQSMGRETSATPEKDDIPLSLRQCLGNLLITQRTITLIRRCSRCAALLSSCGLHSWINRYSCSVAEDVADISPLPSWWSVAGTRSMEISHTVKEWELQHICIYYFCTANSAQTQIQTSECFVLVIHHFVQNRSAVSCGTLCVVQTIHGKPLWIITGSHRRDWKWSFRVFTNRWRGWTS